MSKNLRNRNPSASQSDAQAQNDLVYKMEQMEENFKKGLEDLHNQYVQQRPRIGDSLEISGFTEKYKEFEKSTKQSLEQLKKEILAFRVDVDSLQREATATKKRNNLKKLIFHGIPEKGHQQTIIDDICNVVTRHLGLTITKNDISSCARIGKFSTTTTNNQPNNRSKYRPVLVEFTTQWKRDDIFYAKKKFIKSGVLVSEMLIKNQYELFVKTREVYKNNAWTIRGDIFVYTNNNRVCIKSANDLQALISKQT